jgi:hypothetical protein
MRQPFATDNFFREPDIQFAVAMKMGKRLAPIAQGGESIGAARQRPILYTEFLNAFD